MSFEEMVVAVVGAVGGIALVAFIFSKVVGLIKTWINRNNIAITEKDFDQLARAFMENKQDMNRRIQNLEAIIADKGTSYKHSSDSKKQIEAREDSIEIEDEDQRDSTADNDGNLRNMLHDQ